MVDVTNGYNTPNMDVAVAVPSGIGSKLRSLKAEDKRLSNVLILYVKTPPAHMGAN